MNNDSHEFNNSQKALDNRCGSFPTATNHPQQMVRNPNMMNFNDPQFYKLKETESPNAQITGIE